jgi:hypothetical protein
VQNVGSPDAGHAFGVAPVQESPHAPEAQVGDPVPDVGLGHECPQVPQLFGSPEVVLVQNVGSPVAGHAFGVVPEQARPHIAELHVGDPVPDVGLGQECPHVPQLLGSPVVRFLHVVGAADGQPVYPRLHVYAQLPASQSAVAFATPVVHRWLHDPQFCESFVVSTHAIWVGQNMLSGAEQPLAQAPLLQTGVVPVQAFPHLPQLDEVVMLVSQPSSGLVVQCA